MVKVIGPEGERSRELEQQSDISRRRDFCLSNTRTQQKIIELLTNTAKLLGTQTEGEAQVYILEQLSGHTLRSDRLWKSRGDGIDWDEVRRQIVDPCFSDHDMDGYTIVPRRILSELIVFQSLSELEIQLE